MFTFLLILLLFTVVIFIHVATRFKVFQWVYDNQGGRRLNINYKLIVGTIAAFFAILFQPYDVVRINAGAVGLKESLIGDNRGIGSVKLVSGFQLFNKYFERIYEIETDQKNVHYETLGVIVKGGFSCKIKPTFNYKVNPDHADQLFIELRQTFKQGGLKAVETSWLETAILGGVNDVSNRFAVDSIFNHREAFEQQIGLEVNKRVGKYFEVTQLRTNILPPESLQKSIEGKTQAIQEAEEFEFRAKRAIAENKEKVARAQGDYEAAVLEAKTKEALSQPKMLELFRAETDRTWAEKGVSPYGTNNTIIVGKPDQNLLLNLKK
jgi:regulator of protease activity HflC (stomatin/prohibitin superfamily)